uniref:ERAP1_C domain-containing protein n=1 Tax=Angiostrongylus cantonensis TaxID=6313 RepID=A0A0K0DFJ8_ANGCA
MEMVHVRTGQHLRGNRNAIVHCPEVDGEPYEPSSSTDNAVLLSNAGFHLGMMLTSRRNTGDVVEALTALARKRVRDTGRQVAESDCAERLLELFFDDEVHGAKELVLMLCKGSADIRDRMGEARVIQRIVESANDSISNCKLLTAFAQEAWGRADLRESGALDFLISRLSSIDFRSKDRLEIVQPLHHFVHDINGTV